MNRIARLARVSFLWLAVSILPLGALAGEETPPAEDTAETAAPDALVAAFDEKGIASLKQGGFTLMDPKDRRAKLQYIRVLNPDAKHGWDQHWDPKATETVFDEATKTLRQTFAQCTLAITWTQPKPSQIDTTVEIVSTADEPIIVKLFLGTLRLPRTHHTFNAAKNIPDVRVFPHPGGALAVLNPPGRTHPPSLMIYGLNHSKRLDAPAADGTILGSGFLSVENHFAREAKHPIVDNKWFDNPGSAIRPGQTVTWKFSIGAAKDKDAFDPVVAQMKKLERRQEPMKLAWSDRRPIGTIFWCHSNQKWPTNPRGFNFGQGKKHDVTTAEGKAVFKKELLEYVDRCIENCRKMNAQGVIIWDLEGEELWHPISYIGDPRVLPQAAPELNELADEVFKRFTDAGLRTGLTIRPTDVYMKKPGDTRSWWHRDVKDPVQLMCDKIAYAKERWGTTIFYLDSNVFGKGFDTVLPKNHGVPWTMPAAMLEEVNKRHPDVLVIPEWAGTQHYRFGAPYSSPNNRQMCTPGWVREIWPDAFRVVACNPGLMRDHWSNYLNGVMGGDVLLFPAWYGSLEGKYIEMVYAEAALAKTVPEAVASAAAADLPALLQNESEAVRYHAALKLGETPTPEAAALLAGMLEDTSIPVRRAALVRLAKVEPTDPAVVERLAQIVAQNTRGLDSVLRPFAADALGACGEAGVPVLTKLLATKDRTALPFAVRAIQATGTRNEEAIQALLGVVGKKLANNMPSQEAAIKALGELKAEAAAPVLIELLKDRERNNEWKRLAAARSLGQIGDPAALEALIEQTRVHYSSTAVYSIGRVLDEALEAITGEKGLIGRGEWQRWYNEQKKSGGESEAKE